MSDSAKQGLPKPPLQAEIQSCPLLELPGREVQLRGKDHTVLEPAVVERWVAQVVGDTLYKERVKIVIRLDGGPEYEGRGLGVFP
jgi:hypothetical protein